MAWRPGAEEAESLAAGVRALLVGYGAEHPYDEVLSVLGLGGLLVAVPDECLGWWGAHARDAALTPAAERFGLRLRELHPTEAAEGLAHSAEFAQHFRDSYAPLIRRALESEQPALVWRGWPPPLDRQWGVLTAVQGERLLGYTLGRDELTELTGPAAQVYIVEEYQAPRAEVGRPKALLEHAVRVLQAGWQGELPVGAGVQTGAAAYETWHAASLRSQACPLCGGNSYRCQARLTAGLVAARQALAAWLWRVSEVLDEPHRRRAGEWAAVCDGVAARLRPWSEVEALRPQLAGPLGRERFAQVIDEVRQMEARMVAALRDLTRG